MPQADTTIYDPTLFLRERAGSNFAETAFSTDAATTGLPTLGGWSETAFSTDSPTFERAYGAALVQAEW